MSICVCVHIATEARRECKIPRVGVTGICELSSLIMIVFLMTNKLNVHWHIYKQSKRNRIMKTGGLLF